MKNQYQIHDNYLLRLENETLRERLKLIQDKLIKLEKILEDAKKGKQPHSVFADEIRGTIYLYKNGKLIRDNLFFKRSQRRDLLNEYKTQVQGNKNNDFFEISILLNI